MGHELGHNMGISHDFFGDPKKERSDSEGNTCSGVGGVMDSVINFQRRRHHQVHQFSDNFLFVWFVKQSSLRK